MLRSPNVTGKIFASLAHYEATQSLSQIALSKRKSLLALLNFA